MRTRTLVDAGHMVGQALKVVAFTAGRVLSIVKVIIRLNCNYNTLLSL